MATGRQGPAASRRRAARQGSRQGRHHRAARPPGDPRPFVPRRRDGAAAGRCCGIGAPARRRAATAQRAHPGARLLSRGQPIAVLPRSQAVLVHRQQSDADEAHAGQHRRGRRDDDRPRRRQGRSRLCPRAGDDQFAGARAGPADPTARTADEGGRDPDREGHRRDAGPLGARADPGAVAGRPSDDGTDRRRPWPYRSARSVAARGVGRGDTERVRHGGHQPPGRGGAAGARCRRRRQWLPAGSCPQHRPAPGRDRRESRTDGAPGRAGRPHRCCRQAVEQHAARLGDAIRGKPRRGLS